MSRFDKIRAALVKRFRDNWASGAPADIPLAKIEMPNVKLDRSPSEPWARLSVEQGARSSVAVGATRVRGTGVLYLQVFLPEDSGTKTALDAGDNFAAIFDNQTVGLLDDTGWIRLQHVGSAGTGPRDGYQQFTFSVDFQSDENL